MNYPLTKIKPYEDLSFTDDFLFCRILTRKPELAAELLEMILGRRLRSIRLAEPQKFLEAASFAHGVRFDVYLEDSEDTVYDIEMQTTDDPDLFKRMRYCQSVLDADRLLPGRPYRDLPKTMIIFICLQKPSGFEPDLPVYTFFHTCRENPSLYDQDDVRIVVNASGPLNDCPERMRSFLTYLRTQSAADPFTAALTREVEQARNLEEWRHDYMTLWMKLIESKEEGRMEGRAEGRVEGRAEGLKEGHSEGRAEELARIAGLLLSDGMTESQAAATLHISAEELRRITAKAV